MNPTIKNELMGIDPEREVEISREASSEEIWIDSMGGKRDFLIPPTVYRPREDTTMLHRSLCKIKGNPGRLLEIGTGSGAIGTSMAEIGWDVCGIDINPLAIVSARGNHKNQGKFRTIELGIEEIGDDFEKLWDVITWNTPYLEVPKDVEKRLGPLEEAALSWEGEHPIRKLIELANKPGMLRENGCIIALISPSKETNDELSKAISEGWSIRTIDTRSQGGERTAVIALWKGWRWNPIKEKTVASTMTLLNKESQQGECIISEEQTAGYGRNNSTWNSQKGDFTGTWKIPGPTPPILDIQSIHMAASLAVINAISTWKGKGLEISTWTNPEYFDYSIKWPNDIICFSSKTKVAGMLLHAESKGEEISISCGIGINSKPRIVEGEMRQGVSDTGLEGLEKHLHRHLSSWFENHKRVPDVDKKFLQRRWWNAASDSQIIGKQRKHYDDLCVVSKITDSGLEIYSKSGKKEITGIEIHD